MQTGESPNTLFIKKIETQILKICETITPLATESEKDYLKIGASLYSIADQAGQLSELSLNCSELLMGEKTLNIIKNLRARFKNLDTYFIYSINKIDEDRKFLEIVLDEFQNINSPFEAFKKIVKHLNMLSVSIRIESARLTSESNTFSVLADDVLKLAKNAEVILDEITVLIKEIYDSMESLFASINELKSDKYNSTRLKLQPINEVLDKFWKEQENYSNVSKNISGHMEKTKKDINGIVTSLQLQDIVKQNIEHILEAIQYQILSRINSAEEDFSQFSNRTSIVLNIQANQIKDSEQSISNSINNVTSNLIAIKNNTEGIELEKTQIAQLCKGTGNSILADAEKKVLDITHSLIETVTSHNSIIAKIRKTLSLVDEIADTLTKMDELDTTIKILTYNGLIHASRIGNEGAALRVIADSIQNLSNESQQQVKKFNSILDSVKANAEEVKMNESDNQASETEEVIQGISKELEEFFDKLLNINKEMNANNQNFNITIKQFMANLEDTLNGIKIDQEYSDKTNVIMQHISEVCNSLSPYENKNLQEEIIKELKVLQNNYTMDSERDIHKQSIGENTLEVSEVVDSDDDNIELF